MTFVECTRISQVHTGGREKLFAAIATYSSHPLASPQGPASENCSGNDLDRWLRPRLLVQYPSQGVKRVEARLTSPRQDGEESNEKR